MKRISLYKTHLLSLCFFLGTLITIAQNQNSEWSAESYLVAVNNVDVEIESHLTKQGNTFTWEQIGYNNTDTSTFNITSTTGNWNAQNHTGELNYDLTLSDGTTANLNISGTTEGISMLLIINVSNTANESYAFYIDMETLTNL
jgi:hypothetical protein